MTKFFFIPLSEPCITRRNAILKWMTCKDTEAKLPCITYHLRTPRITKPHSFKPKRFHTPVSPFLPLIPLKSKYAVIRRSGRQVVQLRICKICIPFRRGQSSVQSNPPTISICKNLVPSIAWPHIAQVFKSASIYGVTISFHLF